MTWWLLILLYGEWSGMEPEFSGAFKTEAACVAWFKNSDPQDYEGVTGYSCIPLKDTR